MHSTIFYTLIFLLAFCDLNAYERWDKEEDIDSRFVKSFSFSPTKPSIVSNSDEILDLLSKESSCVVNNCVNAINGNYLEHTVDLYVGGPLPLSIERYYSSFTGWNIHNAEFIDTGFKLSACDTEKSIVHYNGGAETYYYPDKHYNYRIQNRHYYYGLTNLSSNKIGGSTNARNLCFNINKKKNHAILTDGSGTKKHFDHDLHDDNKDASKRYYLSLSTIEFKNGCKTSIDYQLSDISWSQEKITNYNSQSVELNSAVFEYKKLKKLPFLTVTTNDGRQSYYSFKKGKIQHEYLLDASVGVHSIATNYFYDKQDKLIEKSQPGGRIQKICYYQEGKNDLESIGTVRVKKDNLYLRDRVLSLKEPVGVDERLYTSYMFKYEKRYKYEKNLKYFIDGTTTVIDAHNNPTVYHYNNCYRLDYIANYLNGSLYRKQNSYWAKNDTPLKGNIACRSLTDATGAIHSCVTYEYDSYGNVTKEHFLGSLTGENQYKISMETEIYPNFRGCDVYTKHYSYSNDGLNLLLTESDFRKKIAYSYFPGTNLLTDKITYVNDVICAREFYDYDANRLIACKIVDDGKSLNRNDLSFVTERHVTRTTYRDKTPIGLPQVVEEKYVDLSSGQEILLKKTVNEHNLNGDLVAQHHFDAYEQRMYTLKWLYDEKSRLIGEIDALENFSNYSYDQNNNLIYERHAGEDYYTEHTYDFSNRLIFSKNVHDSGIILTNSYSYDKLHRMTKSVDWYGNETEYFYDSCGRLIKVAYPEKVDENGHLNRPCEHYSYDIANNPIEIIDARGFSKRYIYTSRGKICQETHPDGYSIRNVYSLDGLLEKTISSKGTVTETTYDYQLRPLTTTLKDQNGQLISCTQKIYNHFHLLKEIDTEGNEINYTYDQSGNLSTISKDLSKIAYFYDSFQRLTKVQHYFGTGLNDYLVKISVYDIQSQIVEERTEDHLGNILEKVGYLYDIKGNRIQTKHYHLENESTTTTNFNAYNEINYTIDALGNVTHTIYHRGNLNEYGKRVLEVEVVDPIGNRCITEYTYDGLIRKQIKKDLMGKVIQKTVFFYDFCNNCVKQEHIVISDNSEKIIVHKFMYNSVNKLINCIEAANTVERKSTSYEYNGHQEKIATVKNDGTTLLHSYDAIGRLYEFKAQDNSFHYLYSYDSNSNVVKVEDIIKKTSTIRSYDRFNKIISETQSNGLKTKYSYDLMNRLTKIILPDDSNVEYVYKNNHIFQVKRKGYTHTYEAYNLAGLIEKSTMIGKAGHIDQKWDALGRLQEIKTSYFTESIPQEGFDAVGNVTQKDLSDSTGKISQKFSYDSLYQITEELGTFSHTFENDSLNNVIKKDKFDHKINHLNQIVSDGEESYAYDLRGNLIQKGHTSFSYDALDRLVSVEKNDMQVLYSYDEFNRRMSKVVKLQASGQEFHYHYLYQGQDEIGTFDEQNKLLNLRVLGSGQKAEMGASVMLELQNKIFAPIHDIYGNIAAIVYADTGKLCEYYRYSAYGEEEIYASNKTLSDRSINPWRFSSKRYDDETGFIYFGYRYFFPKICRWITADPLGFEAGPNLYAYVHNNPLRLLDLYGLEAVENSPFKSMLNTVSVVSFLMGEMIDTLAHHIIPVPIVKDVLQFPAHCMKGGSVKDYVPSYSRDHSFYKVIGKGEPGSMKNIIDGNGICTIAQESIQRGDDLYNQLGGKHTVYSYHNGTRGAVADVFECIFQIVGIPTNATKVFKECVMEARGELGHEGTTYVNVHSQGSLVARDASRTLSDDVRTKIDLFSIGSPIALSKGSYQNVMNYAASADFVTFGTRAYNNLKKSFGGEVSTINVLPTKGNILEAHNYRGVTYSEVYKQRLTDINKSF